VFAAGPAGNILRGNVGHAGAGLPHPSRNNAGHMRQHFHTDFGFLCAEFVKCIPADGQRRGGQQGSARCRMRVIVHQRALAQEIEFAKERETLFLAERSFLKQLNFALVNQEQPLAGTVFLEQMRVRWELLHVQVAGELRSFIFVQAVKQFDPGQKILDGRFIHLPFSLPYAS